MRAGAAGRVTRTSLETQPGGCGGEAELAAAASLVSTSSLEVRPGLPGSNSVTGATSIGSAVGVPSVSSDAALGARVEWTVGPGRYQLSCSSSDLNII